MGENYLIQTLFFISGVYFYSSASILFLWFRNQGQRHYLLLGIMGLIMVGWIQLGSISMYQAPSTESFSISAKWQMNFVVLYLLAFFWFSSLYTGLRRPGLLWFFSALCMVSWGVNIVSENSLLFSDVYNLRIMSFYWGEKINFISGEVSGWATFTYLFSLICVVFTYTGCWFQYHSGERRPALALAVGISIIFLVAVHDFFVDALIIEHFYLTDFGFLPLILLMHYEISRQIWKNSEALKQSNQQLIESKEHLDAALHVVDISTRELSETMELTEHVYLATRMGIIAYEVESGDCIMANPASGSIIGATPEQLMAQNFRSIESWHQSGLLKHAEATIATGQDQQAGVCILNRFGKDMWINCYFSIFINKGAKHLLLVVDDVTTAKQQEAELLKAKVRADSANRAKSEFLASMSHEIRTPMNAVQGMLELLRRSDLPKKLHKMVDTVANSNIALLNLLDNVLDLSKIEDDRFEVEMTDFRLTDLLKDLKEISTHKAKEKGLSISFSLDENIPASLHGDLLRIRQVLWNLISNAIKFTAQGNITVRVESLGVIHNVEHIEIMVKDTGVGVAQDKLSTIFDPFTQVDASISRKYQGTGLGLAICQRLVDMMGGEITVESELGKGSLFRVELRLKVADELKMPKDETIVKPQSDLPLLLVEDEPVSRAIVEALLSDEGYKVTVAANGAEALDKIVERPSGVILMDLRMPDMDGFETTRRIRALPNPGITGVKIVAFTGDVMKETVAKCYEVGMDGVIAKPINVQEINKVIAALTQSINVPKGNEKLRVSR